MKKVALVTGGAQGIGKAIAVAFLKNEYTVVIADRDERAGQECTKELSPLGPILFFQADVSQEKDVRRLIQILKKELGRLDVLVNNAGVVVEKPVDEISLSDWNNVIGTNLTSVFLCTKYALPLLRKTRGAVVNMASTRALMSEKGGEAYAASKGGIVALTHALAISLGPDVRVNCVSPGWIDVSQWKKKAHRRPATLRSIDHEQHPVGRIGRPEDISSLVLFLSGPEAGFITGSNFIADGGMTRKMIYAE